MQFKIITCYMCYILINTFFYFEIFMTHACNEYIHTHEFRERKMYSKHVITAYNGDIFMSAVMSVIRHNYQYRIRDEINSITWKCNDRLTYSTYIDINFLSHY